MKTIAALLMASLAGCAGRGGGADGGLAAATARAGPVVLEGVLGYRGELLLYDSEADYRRGRRCTSGWSKHDNPEFGRLTFAGRRVRITGEMFRYSVGEDALAALLSPFKNVCASAFVFRADDIRLVDPERPGGR